MFNEQNIARLLDIANAACHAGDVYNAKCLCEAVLAIKPNFVPANLCLAYSHMVVDEFEKSAEILDVILKENPQDEDAIFLLSLQFYMMGDSGRARITAKNIENSENVSLQSFAKEIATAPDIG